MSRQRSRRRSYGRRQHELGERRERATSAQWSIDELGDSSDVEPRGGLRADEYGGYTIGRDFAR